MPQSLDLSIRDHLSRYVAGETTLDRFKEWFVPAVWNLDPDTDPEIGKTVNQVLLALAEVSNGDWSEDELKTILQPLALPADDCAARDPATGSVRGLPTAP